MKLVYEKGPYLKDSERTNKIMKRVLIALLPIILFSFYKNGIIPFSKEYTNIYGLFQPLILILTAGLTSLGTEFLYNKYLLKLKNPLQGKYAFFPGLFFSLLMSINTPLWMIVMGAFFATVVGKLLFGGFGHNIFNPALVGALFITVSYGALIPGGYLNAFELDTITGPTALATNYIDSFPKVIEAFGGIGNYIFGFIPGTLGETPKLLIIMSFIFLAVTKTIKYLIPLTYVGVVFITTFVIGSVNGLDITFPLFQIFTGGLLLGAVFMATDPVTTPTTRLGQVLFGIGLGLLTVIFRFLTPYPEGVLTSILTMNMLVILIDELGDQSQRKIILKTITLIIGLGLIIGTGFLIGNKIKSPVELDNNYQIIEKANQKYQVSQKGFGGLIKAEIIFEKDLIKEINIMSQNESLWQNIEKEDYLQKLIDQQDNLEALDTVSGTTITSQALKDLIKNTKDDYKE
ncbi:MAG: RnfABCDGE type electron transport complex subunit D [Bacilli bacterium]